VARAPPLGRPVPAGNARDRPGIGRDRPGYSGDALSSSRSRVSAVATSRCMRSTWPRGNR
jgi:hypothetical protein